MVWVDCIIFICSYYDAIVDLIIYGFVMFRELEFEENVDVFVELLLDCFLLCGSIF